MRFITDGNMAGTYKYKIAVLVDDSYIDNQISIHLMENGQFAEQVLVLKPMEAIEFIKEAILLNKPPDVLFLDIRMPVMNGYDFLNELEILPGFKELGLKLFILSSSLDPRDFKEIKKNKLVSGFIAKPLTNNILESI